MIDTWLSAINDHTIIGVIFLDFRKAFDEVNHEILLKKLQTYGLGNCSLKWFSSYLSDRYQKVSIGPSLSGQQHTYVGVAQGSILGLLLFLIFINDLFLVIKMMLTFLQMILQYHLPVINCQLLNQVCKVILRILRNGAK